MRQFLGLKILILLFQQLGNDQLYFSLVSIFVTDLAIAESASLVDKERLTGTLPSANFFPSYGLFATKKLSLYPAALLMPIFQA